MKSNLGTIALLFFVSFVRAQNCNIGIEDTTGYDNAYGPYTANYISGFSFNLAVPGTLQSINLIGLVPGSPVQMAVYTDVAGAPGNLVSSSAIDTVTSGINSFPVTPVQLNPGDYWVMAAYGISEWSVCHHSQNLVTIYYLALPFGSPMPSTGAGFMSNTVAATAYFLEISCITGVENTNIGSTEIKIYPNPASDFIYVSTFGIANKYLISDMYGQFVAQGTVRNNNGAIEIRSLKSGIYFVVVSDESNNLLVRKIVKL